MSQPMNILLVEDNEVDVDMLRRGLRKIDVQGDFVRARDGREALDFLSDYPAQEALAHPFFVLLDINMPRMNGHEFMSSLRQDPKISNTRVIVFSTSDNPKDVTQAYKQNAIGYVVKPDTSAELVDALRDIQQFWERCAHPPAPTLS